MRTGSFGGSSPAIMRCSIAAASCPNRSQATETLDNGGVVSFSIWDTAEEAQHAVDLAASWVKDNLADRVKLREEHTGDLSWDESA